MALAQRCREAIVTPPVRIVSSQAQLRRQSRQLPHPRSRESHLARSCGVIQPGDVRVPRHVVERRRETVRRDVDHLAARCNEARDVGFDRLAMRPVVAIDDVLPALGRQCARDLREQRSMPDRAVQVDQQARRGGGVQRRTDRVGQFMAEFQCARIPAAVAVEQRLPARKERGVGGRDLAPTVFAADDELIPACGRQRSSSGHIVRGCHAVPVYFLVSTLLSLEAAAPVPAPVVEPDPGLPPEPTVPEAPPTMPVSAPFAVTSVPCPGTATDAPGAAGESPEGTGYSPLLAGDGCGAGDCRSWQAASVTTTTAAAAAIRFSVCSGSFMVTLRIRLTAASRSVPISLSLSAQSTRQDRLLRRLAVELLRVGLDLGRGECRASAPRRQLSVRCRTYGGAGCDTPRAADAHSLFDACTPPHRRTAGRPGNCIHCVAPRWPDQSPAVPRFMYVVMRQRARFNDRSTFARDRKWITKRWKSQPPSARSAEARQPARWRDWWRGPWVE